MENLPLSVQNTLKWYSVNGAVKSPPFSSINTIFITLVSRTTLLQSAETAVCAFSTDDPVLVPVTPGSKPGKNAGWAMSPDQECKPGGIRRQDTRMGQSQSIPPSSVNTTFISQYHLHQFIPTRFGL
ncbi:hypothetical protein E4U16_006757 [Claviceps sp. LM84 group G4]|nr:hypothetical protein E4U33_006351 [Claviceps sp. LM78 group G4]KAG6070575.1 hypothetical protein E4U16_006757 [Claviceps sp. LM84 group G4]